MRKAILARENLLALHFTSLLGDGCAGWKCLDLWCFVDIWNEDGKGWVSRVLSYLESLNTRNAFTKKLNDKEERG
jgi:hypothetical protein